MTDPKTEWPTEYQAGTTLKVKRSYAEFPAPTWTLKVYWQGRVKFTSTAAPDGSAHLFTIAANDTDTEVPAGVYQWTEIAENGGLKYEVDRGVLTVIASFADATTGSLQLAIEKELEAVEARIAERLAAGGDMEEFGVGDRSARLVELEELYKRRDLLKAQLRKVAEGGTFSREVVMRFTGTGLRH